VYKAKPEIKKYNFELKVPQKEFSRIR